MQLIREILAKIDEIQVDGTNMNGPNLGPGDTVIGLLPVELQKFFVVLMDEKSKFDQMYAQLNAELDKMGDLETATQAQREDIAFKRNIGLNRWQTVEHMFWSAVVRAFPQMLSGTDGSVYISRNWEVALDRNSKSAGRQDYAVCLGVN